MTPVWVKAAEARPGPKVQTRAMLSRISKLGADEAAPA